MTYVVPVKSTLSTIYNESTYEASTYNDVISTDAQDDVITEWDKDTEFTQGQFVKVSALKRLYRCAASSSTGEFPPANSQVFTDYGAVNSYKMFDEVINSQTKFDSSCNVSIGFNRSNTIGILNIKNVYTVQIEQVDNVTSEVVYSKTIELANYGASSLYDYWYKQIQYEKDIVLFDLVYLPDSKINIIFSGNENSLVGSVISGLADNIAITLYGSSVKLNDFSTYQVDEYGNTTFSKRGYSRTITGQVIIDATRIDETIYKLSELRGAITLFSGDEQADGYKSLMTLGYIKDLKIPIDSPSKSKFPITIIGVV